MSGIQTECRSVPRLGIVGCGRQYSGETQHSVAKVAWSAHPDGRAHVTGTREAIDLLWEKGVMREPATVEAVETDERGRLQRRRIATGERPNVDERSQERRLAA